MQYLPFNDAREWSGLVMCWWLLGPTPMAISSELAGRFHDEARCIYFGDHAGAAEAIRRRDTKPVEPAPAPARRERQKKLTTNQIIRQFAESAFAYIPVSDRAKWLRGWRTTARCVMRETLKARLERHVQRMRLKCEISEVA